MSSKKLILNNNFVLSWLSEKLHENQDQKIIFLDALTNENTLKFYNNIIKNRYKENEIVFIEKT